MSLNHSSFNILLPLLIVVSTIPYLFYNVSTRNPRGKKIFMGDAGSMYMGLTVIWLLTLCTQHSELGNATFRPVTALWLIAIPLMDMLAIMIRRMKRGDSPFKADNGHIHHIFLAHGFTPRKTLWALSSIAICCSLVGILGEKFLIPDWIMLALFLACFCVYSIVSQKLCVLQRERVVSKKQTSI